MWALRAILIALVVVAIIAFVTYNPSQKVDINLIYAQYVEVPLLTVIFWSFASGILVSLILFISIYIKLSVQMRNANKRIIALESEVTVLRNRPIEESASMIKDQNSVKEVKSPFESGE